MNLPLYSLVTYVIIPRLNTQKCVYRASTQTISQLKKIQNILELDEYNIKLVDLPRTEYFNNYVSKANVVIFVGKPENAEQLIKNLNNNTMFIYYGVGQNPIIVEKDADLKLASKKIVDSILFNYGQDCAKPNAIIVNNVISEKLKEELIKEINLRVNDNKTTIKKLQTLKEVSTLHVSEVNNIIYGGNIDFRHKTLEPVIISKKLKIEDDTYNEYYAPIFRLMVYDNMLDIKQYFSNARYKDENMNISLFGSNEYIEKLPSSIILKNSIVSDIDDGSSEYGGYGKNVSFINYKGIRINKPLLINREIEQLYDNNFLDLALENNTNNKKRIKNILYLEIKSEIIRIFNNELLFSFIFGSYAKNSYNQTSDVDIFACIDKINNKKIDIFREWYFKFHYKYGLFPDFIYPGEIVTKERLNEIIKKNKEIEFKLYNSSDVFDSIFYTQILTDQKTNIFGDEKKLLYYEFETKKYIQEWCVQIYDLLIKNDMIKSERENMKCLIAMSNNDLLYFSKKLKYERNDFTVYETLASKIDDGFFLKSLRRSIN